MAPNFLRTLSQRFTKNKDRPQPAQPAESAHSQQPETTSEDGGQGQALCQCRVQLLDQTDLNLAISKTIMGQELKRRVFAHLDLEESDYFGLQFTDHMQVHHWLDSAKRVRKQIPVGPPYTLRFRVKFFSNEPANLRDELTRYLFFLQIRQDLQTGLLECPVDVAVELAALALQSEFGDFNRHEHSSQFISEFRFHPLQDAQMECKILQCWADSQQLRGLSPSQSELTFLDKARRLPLYGVDLHLVQGRDGCQYRIGLSPQGILVLDGRQKIGLFLWEKIQRLDFRGRRISLVVEEEMPAQKGGQLVQLHTFVFQLGSNRAAKHLWKCAIEFHTFYRLKFPRPPQQQRRVLPPLFRLGSTFRYRGRTEYETVFQQRTAGASSPAGRRCVSAERPLFRRPSRRYAPREGRRGRMDGTEQTPAGIGIGNGAVQQRSPVRGPGVQPSISHQNNGNAKQSSCWRKPMSTEL